MFVTAYDQYAVQAFAQGVLDYLVKPVEQARLAETVARLKERSAPRSRRRTPRRCCSNSPRSSGSERRRASAAALDSRTVGQSVRLIAVDEIDFLRSDEKYTLVAWRGDEGEPGEALVRTAVEGARLRNLTAPSSPRCTAR